ncbi:hypothetical protein BDZ89DRAFT_1067683 [Hymenopellis radicata]|nr:hypothetical protein BDZ89DRAFT_1067683 [Hymenopellis radicata]
MMQRTSKSRTWYLEMIIPGTFAHRMKERCNSSAEALSSDDLALQCAGGITEFVDKKLTC